ncbi:hypothetical protein C8R45DRAFT_1120919 [Mycena sanguinolenta]|nr:hypothetical protein C8R45DRAFT_1120919 [Mycena sanguinolenta]
MKLKTVVVQDKDWESFEIPTLRLLLSTAMKKKSTTAKKQAAKKTENQTTKAQDTKKAGKRARSPEAESETEESHPQKRSKKADNAAAEKEAAPVANSSKATTNASPPVSLSGKFDLYAMGLPFLAKVYLPQGESEPQFVALYKKILEYQAKPDSTARCLLPDPKVSLMDGRLRSAVFEDPMEGMPWDIAIQDLEHVDVVNFTAAETAKFPTAPRRTPGVSGRTALEDEGHCGVQSASGVFRMQLAYTGKDDAGNEVNIFEGYLSFDVSHSGLYRRKGHGSGDKIGFPFWAVRARRDAAGKEIGLEAQ